MRVLFYLLAVLVMFGAAEAVLRFGVGLGDPPLVFLDADTEYELVPSKVYYRYHNRIEINSFGMRATDHSTHGNPQETRVLLIGDSVVYGNHFLDQAETISYQMARALSVEHGAAACQMRIMPAAASSWGPENQVAYVSKTGLLDADLGILLVSAHDLYDVKGASPFLPYRTKPSVSALHDAGALVWERIFEPRIGAPRQISRVEKTQISLAALNELRGKFVAASTPIVLMYHPTLQERSEGPSLERGVFKEWAEDNSVPFVDLGPLPMTKGDYRDSIHPSASGAEQIAAFAAQVVKPYLLSCS